MQGELGLDRARVEAFVVAVEERYNQRNPYHNSVHAADVVQGSWLFLRAAARTVAFPRLEARPGPLARSLAQALQSQLSCSEYGFNPLCMSQPLLLGAVGVEHHIEALLSAQVDDAP